MLLLGLCHHVVYESDSDVQSVVHVGDVHIRGLVNNVCDVNTCNSVLYCVSAAKLSQ